MASGAYDIGVFWDYENVQVPSNRKGSEASNAIRAELQSRGRIVQRQLYYDSGKQQLKSSVKSSLDLSGFSLVDCPTRGRKETLDKKLIVDLMHFAWGRSQATDGRRSCVVLISSDGDYAYVLSRLRDMGTHTIVMFGKCATLAEDLLDACDEALSFFTDVLPPHSLVSSASPEQRPLLRPSAPLAVSFPPPQLPPEVTLSPTEDATSVAGQLSPQCFQPVDVSSPSRNEDEAPTSQIQHVDLGASSGATMRDGEDEPDSESEEQSVANAGQGGYTVLLNCISTVQRSRVDPQASADAWISEWAVDSQVAHRFYERRGRDKDRYQADRESAKQGKYIQYGRRCTVGETSPGGSSIEVMSSMERPSDSYSKELYLRLTERGRALLGYGATTTSSTPVSPSRATVNPYQRPRPAGVIMLVSNETWPECMERGIFGLDFKHKRMVESIDPGTPLFAYNFNANPKELYFGLEATSTGRHGLDPAAFGGKFPMQVRFLLLERYGCINISQVRHIFTQKTTTTRDEFELDLNNDQLVALRRILDSAPQPELDWVVGSLLPGHANRSVSRRTTSRDRSRSRPPSPTV